MRRDRPVFLLTGFGPFPGAPRNASSLLVEELARVAGRRLPGFAVHAETLPTEWRAGPERLAQLIDTYDPVVAVHFGVSHRARGFVVETRARNACHDALDACGAAPDTLCVAADGPTELSATLPTGLIVERLRRKGLPVQLSRDAGGYLCNAVLYHSLMEAKRREGRGIGPKRGFIHIPDRLAAGGGRRAAASLLDWDAAVEGGLEIMAVSGGVGDRAIGSLSVDAQGHCLPSVHCAQEQRSAASE
jgi:pyroglutamyl-peptidase